MHLDIGSNVRNDHRHGRMLDRTIQIFEAFPEVLCEDSSLANELLEKQEATDGSNEDNEHHHRGSEQFEYNSSSARRASVVTSTKVDQDFQHEVEINHELRTKNLYEQVMNSSRFYIFAYENPNYSFQSLLHQRTSISEDNMDPSAVLQKFEDEYGSRLLRYTLVTSTFNVDSQSLAADEDGVDGVDDSEEDFVDEAEDKDDDAHIDRDDIIRSKRASKQIPNAIKPGGGSSNRIFPGLHTLKTCSWLAPGLFCSIDSIRRMDPVKACSQVCNAQLIVAHSTALSMSQAGALSSAELASQPAGDIVNGPSLLVAAISNLSNIVVAPHCCAVGLHATKVLVSMCMCSLYFVFIIFLFFVCLF